MTEYDAQTQRVRNITLEFGQDNPDAILQSLRKYGNPDDLFQAMKNVDEIIENIDPSDPRVLTAIQRTIRKVYQIGGLKPALKDNGFNNPLARHLFVASLFNVSMGDDLDINSIPEDEIGHE